MKKDFKQRLRDFLFGKPIPTFEGEKEITQAILKEEEEFDGLWDENDYFYPEKDKNPDLDI